MTSRILDPIVAALAWWIEGLWLGLPARVRDNLFRARDRLVVSVSNDEFEIQIVADRAGSPSVAVTLSAGGTDLARTLRASLAFTGDADVTVLLPRSIALTKRLTLPESAEPALRSVLRHELDRITPFATDDIAFDYHVATRAGGKLAVEVVLARSASLTRIAAVLERLELRATVVTTADAEGAPMPVNLLVRRPKLRMPFAKPPMSARAVMAAGLALLAGLYLPLLRYDALLRGHERDVAAVREEAVAARAALDEQEAVLERTNYLTERRGSYVAPIALLLELTERLPEHTWLVRASITNDGVQLQGESAAASELLQVVESMEGLRDAQFQAPVARSGESGREQFTIIATPARNSP